MTTVISCDLSRRFGGHTTGSDASSRLIDSGQDPGHRPAVKRYCLFCSSFGQTGDTEGVTEERLRGGLPREALRMALKGTTQIASAGMQALSSRKSTGLDRLRF